MRSLSVLLFAGFLGFLSTPRDLQRLARLSTAADAALCFVSKQTYRRWGRAHLANPSALRLLAIHAGYLPWVGWRGWELHQVYLFPPGGGGGGRGPGGRV